MFFYYIAVDESLDDTEVFTLTNEEKFLSFIEQIYFETDQKYMKNGEEYLSKILQEVIYEQKNIKNTYEEMKKSQNNEEIKSKRDGVILLKIGEKIEDFFKSIQIKLNIFKDFNLKIIEEKWKVFKSRSKEYPELEKEFLEMIEKSKIKQQEQWNILLKKYEILIFNEMKALKEFSCPTILDSKYILDSGYNLICDFVGKIKSSWIFFSSSKDNTVEKDNVVEEESKKEFKFDEKEEVDKPEDLN